MPALLGSRVRRATIVSVTALSVVLAGGPAFAKTPAHTTISAHLTTSTVLTKSTATVSGTVTPTGGTVVLERLVSAKWLVVAHAKPGRTGAYTFAVRAPKAAATWSLKVVRAASSSAKAGTSATLHLHVVTQQFAVAAASASAVTLPSQVVVTGVAVPAVGGTVQVQRLVGTTWTAVATGKVGSGGAFSISSSLTAGTQQLRVVKPFTSTIAQGTSIAFTVVVSDAATPTVATAALPAARVAAPYSALLTASGGNGLYQWAATGLPAGITLSAAGLLSGTPTAQGTAAVTVTVTDGAGHTAGSTLSLAIGAQAGRLFAAGDNSTGELGIGSLVNTSTIVPVQGMTAVTAAATGNFASLAVKADGSVWAWGQNTEGELGNGTLVSSTVPVQVPGLSGVTAVAEGSRTSYALKSDGTVWAWGGNADGQVGNGDQVNQLSPVQVGGLSSVVAISATELTAYALRSDGTVWDWGSNNHGQLGDDSMTDRSTPGQVVGLTGIKAIASASHSGYAVQADGTVAAWGSDIFDDLGNGLPSTISMVPVAVSGVSQVTQIAGGLDAVYVVTSSGAVLGWGTNSTSELAGATASNPSNAVTIATGGQTLAVAGGLAAGYALLANQTVVSWGNNAAGQLGNGSTTTGTAPVAMTAVAGALSVIANGFSDSVFVITS